jgi:hypothetical protein
MGFQRLKQIREKRLGIFKVKTSNSYDQDKTNNSFQPTSDWHLATNHRKTYSLENKTTS